jgi:hypothetical protein
MIELADHVAKEPVVVEQRPAESARALSSADSAPFAEVVESVSEATVARLLSIAERQHQKASGELVGHDALDRLNRDLDALCAAMRPTARLVALQYPRLDSSDVLARCEDGLLGNWVRQYVDASPLEHGLTFKSFVARRLASELRSVVRKDGRRAELSATALVGLAQVEGAPVTISEEERELTANAALCTGFSDPEQIARGNELARYLCKLPEETATIASDLMAGYCQAEIARRHGLSKAGVCRSVSELRRAITLKFST